MFIKTKGWGRLSQGLSLTPFDNRQATIIRALPSTKLRPELPHTVPPCSPLTAPAKPRIRLGRPGVQRLAARPLAGKCFDPHAFRQMMLTNLQPSGGSNQQAGRMRLSGLFDDIAAQVAGSRHLADADDGLPDLGGISMLSVCHAIHSITVERQLDIDALTRGLNVLRQIDLDRELINLDAPRPRTAWQPEQPLAGAFVPHDSDRADEEIAWRIAYRLGSSSEGLRLLQSLCRQPAEQVFPHATLAEAMQAKDERNGLLLTYMTACNELASDGKNTSFEPRRVAPAALRSEILERLRIGASHPSLLEKGVLALHARFEQLDNPLAGLIDVPHAWAITAINNGFFSHQSLKDPGARLEKLATQWVNRATPKHAREKENVIQKYERKFRFHQLNPQKKKSPFHALAKTAGKDGIDFGIAGDSGLAANRAISSAIGEMITALEANEHPRATVAAVPSSRLVRPEPVLPAPARLKNAARLEIMKCWHGSDQFLHLTDEKRLADPDVKAVQAAVHQRLGLDKPTLPDQHAQRRTMVEQAVASENKRLRPTELIETAKDIPGCNVARVTELLSPETVPSLPAKPLVFNRENLTHSLCSALDQMDKGSRINLSSGGVLGVGTKGATATLSGVFSASLLRSRLDLRFEKSRQAICEIGVTTHAVEMVVGTQTVTKRQSGLGWFAGIGILSNVYAGIGNDNSVSDEISSTRAILLRLARPRNGLVDMRQTVSEFKRVVKVILDQPGRAYAPDCPVEEQNVLIELFKRFPELSIGQKGSSKAPNRTVSIKASLITGAFARLGFYRAGISAVAEVERRNFKPYEYSERSGRIRIARFTRGHGNRVNVAAGINAASFAVPIPGMSGRPDQQTVSDGGGSEAIRWTQSTPNLDMLQFNMDLYKSGLAHRTNLVSEDGQIGGRSTSVRIHTNAADFARSVRADLEYWTHSMARHWRPDAYHRGGSDKEFALGQERAKIVQFLDAVIRDAQPSHTFHEQLEIKPAVARQLTSLFELARQAHDKPDAATCEREIRSLIDAESSWRPSHLIAYDGAMSQGAKRMDLMLKAGKHYNKGSTRVVRMV